MHLPRAVRFAPRTLQHLPQERREDSGGCSEAQTPNYIDPTLLQLEQVAAHREIKTYALIQPHFATISPLLISSKPTAPAILAAALDCFHQSHESLLRITREYTLPTIVAQEQKQMLVQVAAASAQTVPVMLTHGPSAAAVLAYLFMRPDGETTNRGLKFFIDEVNSLGNNLRLGQVLGSVKVPLVYKLALELGDEDPVVSAQAERALKSVQRYSEGLTSKSKVELGTILKDSIVGILSHMNRGLNESSTHRPLRDKQRIIRSLEAVTLRVGPAIAGFSPQIMATLQSALEVKGLRGVTISAFKSFIESLKFAEIGPFIGPTTATFVRLWPEFTPEERQVAGKMIDYIVQNLDGLSRFVQEIADLSNIPELSNANAALVEIRKGWSFNKKSRYLQERIASENDVVTLQALKELKALMASNRPRLQELAAGDTFNKTVGSLVKHLFDAAVRDGPENRQIRNMSFECIGILGALDPDRFELPPANPPFIVLQNFADHEESIKFALHLIENLLIGAYRSTNDTKHQEFLAYAIQELLSFCGFTADLVLPSSSSKAKVDQLTRDRWNSLPKNVLETCGPLLGGSFSFKEKNMPREAEYPIYSSTSSYRDWIRIFANDLILKLQGQAVKRIFGAFPPVLHLEDIAVARHLLPHLVLNALISGNEADRDRVRIEMETVLTDQVSPTHQLSENSRILSAQTVFDLMDHLSRWITLARKRQQENKSRSKKVKGKSTVEKDFEAALLNVEGILQDIPHILVGQAALTCKAYARSLLNFESHIVAQRAQKDNVGDEKLQEYYENLHECYADLDEPDGMEGISTKIISPSVLHQIREHESTGRWTSAQSCWEVKLQQKPDEPSNHVGLLRCLRNLGHYDSMRTHIIGILHSRGDETDWDRILAPFNIEASLFIGDWEAVEDALRIPDIEGAEVSFGKVISAMKEGNAEQLSQAFFEAREQLGGPIVAAGKESYRRVYDSVIHLHILQELEAIHIARDLQPEVLSPQLIKSLNLRLASTSPSFRAREPILNMRRTALRIGVTESARDEIAELWLETSKIARKAGHSQTAYSAILQARDLNAEFVFLQSAKLLMATDQPYKALQDLDNALRSKIPPNFGREDFVDRPSQPIANHPSPQQASLRRARWMVEAGRLDYNEAVYMYSEAAKLAPDWESPHYYLGRYCDEQYKSLGQTLAKRELTFMQPTVKHFATALTHGTKFIYQAMPRMLTLWLEFGENPRDYDIWRCFDSINRAVHRSIKDLPPYQWLTVLPQLVSRILHPNGKVSERLKSILLKVLQHYPHHGFWAMASGAKSNGSKRSAANMDVFEKAKKGDRNGTDTPRLIDQGLRLVDELLALCNHHITKTDSLSLKKIFPRLADSIPDELYIPLQSSLTVSLPSDASHFATHKPFPDRLVSFKSFDDTIVIMTSLQRPRKITVWGSDGRQYSFLCKPKDDLRKDARLMEFNSMIIKLLKKDGDARNRRLDIRTYAVVPLNEDCGLIEWVPHVVVLRGILNKSYQARGIAPWGPELKRVFDTIRDDPRKTGDRFINEVLKNYPPVFHEWFLENFPEPSAWLRARLAYSRTAAVISMVGFVLGLGDRHCENILLDGTTGDTVHVDFNCLFDRGRTFDVAEQVPFRLTHNIIDGMGVSGIEGVYRRAAEITLRILRDNKDSLMSVLETFMHDPLVEWVPSVSKRVESRLFDSPAGRRLTSDHIKSKAKTSLTPISNKLSGLQVTSAPSSLGAKEVGVGEQVERLIREARDPKNLGSMYVGW
ncbi:hypothetical protein BCR35DRAFT_264576 [Leucosporidium creatinivorum]|uniref:non-specific serine/threonine protein kinase n=1 Tax=Leucosporidium creatinivorum TaxID=106004 RepID=A0A1Y2FN71_9BASI|nr:hypothetical protein BCR35DRAFT_264576 [Leucosporidium creatinivorum]